MYSEYAALASCVLHLSAKSRSRTCEAQWGVAESYNFSLSSLLSLALVTLRPLKMQSDTHRFITPFCPCRTRLLPVAPGLGATSNL